MALPRVPAAPVTTDASKSTPVPSAGAPTAPKAAVEAYAPRSTSSSTSSSSRDSASTSSPPPGSTSSPESQAPASTSSPPPAPPPPPLHPPRPKLFSRIATTATTALTASPLTLAALRIVLPLVILISPELHVAPALASAPEHLTFLPEGLGAISRIPIDASTARILQIVALTAAATGALGYFSRLSMAALTVSGGLLFSLSQRQGAVLHDMHLFWLTALLAASPCGDAWSLDAWGNARSASSRRYGVPVALARLLLGLVYFFPGLHKMRVSGLAWISAENVVGHMHAKWLQYGTIPAVRIDHARALCSAGALFVVAFELSFVVLVLASRPTRYLALAAGLLFHASTQVLFFIPFLSLWACYVVLLDGAMLERLERRVRRILGRRDDRDDRDDRDRNHDDTDRSHDDIATSPTPLAPLLVGLPLVAAVIVQGARAHTHAWPIACYPTFAHVQPHAIPDIVVELTRRDGTTTRLTGRERAVRSQSEWGHVFRLSGAYGDSPRHDALREHALAVARRAGIPRDDLEAARLYRVDVATAPEAWSEPPPEAGVLLSELRGPSLGIR